MSGTPIDRAMLQELCDLARLHIPRERESLVLMRLQRIVDAFSGLVTAVADGSGVGPPGHEPQELDPAALRQDRATAPMDRADVLANAPRAAADAFVVPRVVDA